MTAKKNSFNESILTTITYEEAVSYIPEYKKIWRSNSRHCDPNKKDGRSTFTDNNKDFAPEWLGEDGFARFSLFLTINNYKPKYSQLDRIDPTKGFSPSNCRVIPKIYRSPKGTNKSKQNKASINKKVLDKVESTDNLGTTNITNNIIMFSDAKEFQQAQALLKVLGFSGLKADESNHIIYLSGRN